MIRKIVDYIKNMDVKKIFIIDFAILIMGIIMLILGYLFKFYGGEVNDTRVMIGSSMLTIWFVLFPAISQEEKDKIISRFGIHSLLVIGVLLLLSFELSYLMKYLTKGPVWREILFAIIGVIIIAYLLYILVSFIQTFLILVKKVVKVLFPEVQEKTSGIKNVLEGLTAFILALTGFGGSIIGFINIMKQIIG